MEQSEIIGIKKLKIKKNADTKINENIYFYSFSKEDCLKKLNTDKNAGLSVFEAERRKAEKYIN